MVKLNKNSGMKSLLKTFLIIIVYTIKYIESCWRLTDCSWSSDPCWNYKDMYSCLKNADCKWGNIEEPPEPLVDAQIQFGGAPGVEVGLAPHQGVEGGPNVQQVINGVETCKGKKYKSCYIGCSIF